jgi:hypothetical protein
LGVFMLGGLLVSLVAGALGGPAMASMLILPTVVVMASMFFTSVYFTFRDSFTDDTPDL